MALTLPFDGGFETGNNSQYDATAETSGSIAVVSSYGGYTPSSGAATGYLGHCTLNDPPSGESRAEWVKLYEYADFHGLTKWYTFSLLLDAASNWAALDVDISLGQLLTRNLQGASVLFYLHPIGWQSTTALTIAPLMWGGTTVPGTGTEHRVAVNPAAGSGWDTFIAPATAGSAGSQRFPQWLGPNTMLTGNRPVTVGVWHEFIIAIKHTTDVANGSYVAYHRTYGSGQTFTKVFETTAIYKTVQYNTGLGQPTTSSGGNNTQRFGCYASAGVPGTYHVLIDNCSIQNTYAAAEAMFATETTPSPPPIGRVTTIPRIVGARGTGTRSAVGTGSVF